MEDLEHLSAKGGTISAKIITVNQNNGARKKERNIVLKVTWGGGKSWADGVRW